MYILCVYVNTFMYICIHIIHIIHIYTLYTHKCIYTHYIHVYIYLHIHTICTYIHTYLCIYVHIHMYTHIHIYVYMYIYICVPRDQTQVSHIAAGFFTSWATRETHIYIVLCLVTQSSPSVFDSTDCSPPGSSVHEDPTGKNIIMGCHAILQGIFPTQGLNPSLQHCRQILYHLSHQGRPRILKWGAYLFS